TASIGHVSGSPSYLTMLVSLSQTAMARGTDVAHGSGVWRSAMEGGARMGEVKPSSHLVRMGGPLRIAVSPHEVAMPLRRIVRSFGRAPLRLRQAPQDRRLSAEQQRGVLGPAHLLWAGNSSADN